MKKYLLSPITGVLALIVICVAAIVAFHNPTLTKPEACREYVKAVCEKLVECGEPTTLEECNANLDKDFLCDLPYNSPVEDVLKCVEDFRKIDCEGTMPESCWGLE